MNELARPSMKYTTIEPRILKLSFHSVQVIAAGADVVLLSLASLLGSASYQYVQSGYVGNFNDAIGIGLLTSAVFVSLLHSQGLYEISSVTKPLRYIRRVWILLAIALLFLTGCLFLLKIGADVSRGSMVVFSALAFAIVTSGRVAFGRLSALCVRRRLFRGRRAVTIGEASELEKLAPSEMMQFGIEEVARVGVGRSRTGKGLDEQGNMQVARAVDHARQLGASEIVLLVSWNQERMLGEIGELLRISPLPVKLIPDFAVRNIFRQQHLNFMQYRTVELQRSPLGKLDMLAKRTLDIVLSVTAVVLLAPIFLLIALAIKLDSSGPVLFRQRRCGFDHREFVIFKFRTMIVLEDGETVVQARHNDKRVTRVGRMLRRSSFDELPQLLNVIRGDMSLVGPRPHAMAHHGHYLQLIGNYALRHHVKPGLTGMAQIRGLRGETTRLDQMARRVDQDLWYINHWSFALDIWIMIRTCLVVFSQEAY